MRGIAGYSRLWVAVRRASDSLVRDVSREEAAAFGRGIADRLVEQNARFFKKRNDPFIHPSMTKTLGPIWRFFQSQEYSKALGYLSSNNEARAHDWRVVVDHIWDMAEEAQADIRYSMQTVDSRAHVLTTALTEIPHVPTEAAVYALRKIASEDGLYASMLLRHLLASPAATTAGSTPSSSSSSSSSSPAAAAASAAMPTSSDKQLLVEATLQGLTTNARTVASLWESPLLHDHLQGVGRGRVQPSDYDFIEAVTGNRLDTCKEHVTYSQDYSLLNFIRPAPLVGLPPPPAGKEYDASREALSGMHFDLPDPRAAHNAAFAQLISDEAEATGGAKDQATATAATAAADGQGSEDTAAEDLSEKTEAAKAPSHASTGGKGSPDRRGAFHAPAEFEVYHEAREMHHLFLRKLHALTPRWRGTLDPFSSTPLHAQREAFVNHVYRLAIVEHMLQRKRAQGQLTTDAAKAKQQADQLYASLRDVDVFTPMKRLWQLLGLPVPEVEEGGALDQLAREDAMTAFLKQQGQPEHVAARDADFEYLTAVRGLRLTTSIPPATALASVGAVGVDGVVGIGREGAVRACKEDAETLLLRDVLLVAQGSADPEQTLLDMETQEYTALLERLSNASRFLSAATALSPTPAMRDTARGVKHLMVLYAVHGSRVLGGAAAAVEGRRDKLNDALGIDIVNLCDAVALYVEQNHKAKETFKRLEEVRLHHAPTASSLASSARASSLQQLLSSLLHSASGGATLSDGIVLDLTDTAAASSPRVGALLAAAAMQPLYNAVNAGASHGAVAPAWTRDSGLARLLHDLDARINKAASPNVPPEAVAAHVATAHTALTQQRVSAFGAALLALGGDDAASVLPVTTVDQALSSSRSVLAAAAASHPPLHRIAAYSAAANAAANSPPRQFGLSPGDLVASVAAAEEWTHFAHDNPQEAARVMAAVRHVAACYRALETQSSAHRTAAVVGAEENLAVLSRLRDAALTEDANSDAELSALLSKCPSVESSLLALKDDSLPDPLVPGFAAIAADDEGFDAFLGQAALGLPIEKRVHELVSSIPALAAATAKHNGAPPADVVASALATGDNGEAQQQLLALLASDLSRVTDVHSLEEAFVTAFADALGDATTTPPFVQQDNPSVVGAPKHPRHHFRTTGQYVGPHGYKDNFTFYDMDQVSKTPEELWELFAQQQRSGEPTLADVPAMSFSPPTALPTADQYAFLLATLKGRFEQQALAPPVRFDFVSDVVAAAVDKFATFCVEKQVMSEEDATSLREGSPVDALAAELPDLTSEQRQEYAQLLGLQDLDSGDVMGVSAALCGRTSLSDRVYDDQAAAWYHAANSDSLLSMIRGWLLAARFGAPYRVGSEMEAYGAFNETSALDEKAEKEEQFWMGLMDVLACMRVHDVPANANHMHELISAFAARRDLAKTLELLSEARTNSIPLRSSSVLAAANLLNVVEDRLSVEELSAIAGTIFRSWIASDATVVDSPTSLIDLHLALTSERLPAEWTQYVLQSCLQKCGNEQWVVEHIIERLKFDPRITMAASTMTASQLSPLVEDDSHPGPLLIHAYVLKCIEERDADRLQDALSCAMKHAVVIHPEVRQACLSVLRPRDRHVAWELFRVMDRDFDDFEPAHQPL